MFALYIIQFNWQSIQIKRLVSQKYPDSLGLWFMISMKMVTYNQNEVFLNKFQSTAKAQIKST
jgi:hypothetical protein